ncbi:MAG TPA: CocE/NonD family hydrolase, partial [Emticicia sp.]
MPSIKLIKDHLLSYSKWFTNQRILIKKFSLPILGIFLFFSNHLIYAQQTLEARLSHAQSEYDIQDSVLIKTRDGATISAMVVRKKGDTEPKPVIFQFTIYVRDKGRDMRSLKESADRGYIGVIAYTRGKRFSPNEIYPYENDANDTYEVIDWISKQAWCKGSVGMFGGSYNGFTQWAATKKLHPALKTIVPYVANRPGMGLPMENNIFVNPNYEWAFYVANNKYLDTLTANDRQRFRKLQSQWWQTGVAYTQFDSLDNAPNKWFQRWISHPSFDNYWQNMAPYKADFAHINIPVLAFDGY